MTIAPRPLKTPSQFCALKTLLQPPPPQAPPSPLPRAPPLPLKARILVRTGWGVRTVLGRERGKGVNLRQNISVFTVLASSLGSAVSSDTSSRISVKHSNHSIHQPHTCYHLSTYQHVLGQKPFKCPECTVTFSTKSNRERHMVRKHGLDLQDHDVRKSLEKPYKCSDCSSTFASAGANIYYSLMILLLRDIWRYLTNVYVL